MPGYRYCTECFVVSWTTADKTSCTNCHARMQLSHCHAAVRAQPHFGGQRNLLGSPKQRRTLA